MKHERKPLVWLHGQIKSPPFKPAARIEAGLLLARLQRGDVLTMPHSRPMPALGPRCHELRVTDGRTEWRVMYRADPDAVIVLDVFAKKTRTTPGDVLKVCRKRIRAYEDVAKG